MRIKTKVGSGDDDECKLIDAILGSADKARSTSRSGGASSGPRPSGNASSGPRTSGGPSSGPNSSGRASSGTNSTRSGSSSNGANSNRQSGGQQRTQSGTNQRSSSGSTNSGRQTGGAETNQQSKTSSSSNNIDTIKFNNGTLKMVLNERKTQKMFEGLSGVYEYEFTDKRGNTIKIGSENTFEELSSKDMKYDIELWLLSKANISRASTFEVQDRDSQYGYVGKLEKSVYSSYNFKRDPFIIASLRDRQLKNVNELKFSVGKVKLVLNENGTQKTLQGKSDVFEYEYTDLKGKTHTIYCGNTFKELSDPDIKYEVGSNLLTSNNVACADSYDVQYRNSQYGFVGRLEKDRYGNYVRRIDEDIVRRQRIIKLRSVHELKFSVGKVKPVLNKNGTQKTLEGESGVYEYEYTNLKGKTQTIYCGNTFEELSDPDIKYDVGSILLSSTNVDNANSYDVQNRNSQYGFVGRLEKDRYGNYVRRIDEDIVRRQRIRKLRSVHELKFSVGKLEAVLDKNGTPKTLEGESGVYEYEYTNLRGKTQTIYCGNTFEELSDPDIKYDVGSILLSSSNMDNANSYDVQNEKSQYGYVGKLEKPGMGYYTRKIDPDIIRRQRTRKLRDTQELIFSGGTIKAVFNEIGAQKTLEGQSRVYEYEFKNLKGETQTIYCGNTFVELAEPDIKYYIGDKLLNSNNLKNIKNYDVQDDEAQFGYAGKLVKTDYGFTRRVDPDVVKGLRNRQLSQKNLNFTMAMDDVNTQKTITLQDGRKLYGYRLFDGKNPEDPGKELYIEEDPVELARKMDRLRINKGFTHAEMMHVFDMALQNAYDFSTASRRAQFGYAGSLRDDGEFKVNKQIVEELRDRIRAIAARSEFISLVGKEDRLLEELRNSER